MSRKALLSAAMVASSTLQALEPAIALNVTVGAPVSAFHIYMDPYGKRGMKGADAMKILVLEPEQMLSFTWNAPLHLPQARAAHGGHSAFCCGRRQRRVDTEPSGVGQIWRMARGTRLL